MLFSHVWSLFTSHMYEFYFATEYFIYFSGLKLHLEMKTPPKKKEERKKEKLTEDYVE